MKLQQQPINSIDEIYSDAIMGFFTYPNYFRNLKQCYKAYDIEPDI